MRNPATKAPALGICARDNIRRMAALVTVRAMRTITERRSQKMGVESNTALLGKRAVTFWGGVAEAAEQLEAGGGDGRSITATVTATKTMI
jgi:hypothetical protein